MKYSLLILVLLLSSCAHIKEAISLPGDGLGKTFRGKPKSYVEVGRWKGGKIHGLGYRAIKFQNKVYVGKFENDQKQGLISIYKYRNYSKEILKPISITSYVDNIKSGYFYKEESSGTPREGFNFRGGSIEITKDKDLIPNAVFININGNSRKLVRNKYVITEKYDLRKRKYTSNYKAKKVDCIDGQSSVDNGYRKSARYILGEKLAFSKWKYCYYKEIKKDERNWFSTGLSTYINENNFSFGFRSAHLTREKKKFSYKANDEKKQYEAFETKLFGPTIEYLKDGTVKSSYYVNGKKNGYSLEYKLQRYNFSFSETFGKAKFPRNEDYYKQVKKYFKNHGKDINVLTEIEQKYPEMLKPEFEDEVEVLSESEVTDFFKGNNAFHLPFYVKDEFIANYKKYPKAISRLVKQLRPFKTFKNAQHIYKIPTNDLKLSYYRKGKKVNERIISKLHECKIDNKIFYSEKECKKAEDGLVVSANQNEYQVSFNHKENKGYKSSTFIYPDRVYGDYKGEIVNGIRLTQYKNLYADKREYKVELGTFKDSSLLGKGYIYNTNQNKRNFPGFSYFGGLKEGMPDGKGSTFHISPSNSIFSGNWKNGKSTGKGIAKEGHIEYRGSFVDGKKSGTIKVYYKGKYVDTWKYEKDRRKDRKGKCVYNVRDSKGKYKTKIVNCTYKNGRRVDKKYLAQVAIERDERERERRRERELRERRREQDRRERERIREKKRKRLAKKREKQRRREQMRARRARSSSNTYQIGSNRINPNTFLKSRLKTQSYNTGSTRKNTSYSKSTSYSKKKYKSSSISSSSSRVQKKEKRYKKDPIEVMGTHSMFQPYDTALDLAKTNARTSASQSCRKDGGRLDEKAGSLINKKCNQNKSGKEYKCSVKMNFWCVLRAN